MQHERYKHVASFAFGTQTLAVSFGVSRPNSPTFTRRRPRTVIDSVKRPPIYVAIFVAIAECLRKERRWYNQFIDYHVRQIVSIVTSFMRSQCKRPFYQDC